MRKCLTPHQLFCCPRAVESVTHSSILRRENERERERKRFLKEVENEKKKLSFFSFAHSKERKLFLFRQRTRWRAFSRHVRGAQALIHRDCDDRRGKNGEETLARLRDVVTDGRWRRFRREPDDGRCGKKPTLDALKTHPLSRSLFTFKQDPHHPASDLVNRGPRSCGWQSARWAFCGRKKRESETEKMAF